MEKFNHFLEVVPLWGLLGLSALTFLILGFLIARKFWGENKKRLKRALEDNAYLAAQWAELGASQSELVEKLEQRIIEERSQWAEKTKAWQDMIHARQEEVDVLSREIRRIEENAGSTMTSREVDALQSQVIELQQRDERIGILENRLKEVNEQNVQLTLEHKEESKALLYRIEALKSKSVSDPAIEENNQQLTELLRQRCEELEALRDEFFAKERDLNKFREQNRSLKASVDQLAEKFAARKKNDSELDSVKIELASALDELSSVREVYEKRIGNWKSTSASTISTMKALPATSRWKNSRVNWKKPGASRGMFFPNAKGSIPSSKIKIESLKNWRKSWLAKRKSVSKKKKNSRPTWLKPSRSWSDQTSRFSPYLTRLKNAIKNSTSSKAVSPRTLR